MIARSAVQVRVALGNKLRHDCDKPADAPGVYSAGGGVDGGKVDGGKVDGGKVDGGKKEALVGQVGTLQVASTWLDSHGWVVVLAVGVLVFVLSMALGRRPAAMPLRERGGFTLEEAAPRTPPHAQT